ncbi:MAG: hypothetical protein ACE5GD_07760 [Candidatus Geothermarchaeales archaeon]
MRPAYETALRNPRLDPKDQEFLMGHILPGSQDPYYDKSKIEELRSKYASVNFFPTVTVSVQEEIKKLPPEEKLRLMREILARMPVDEALKEIEIRRLRAHEVKTNGNGYQAKIIGEEELIAYVEMG